VIVDSSALLAVLLNESDADMFEEALAVAPTLAIAAPTALETSIVLAAKLGDGAITELDNLIRELGISVSPFSEKLYYRARTAYLYYGKGRHAAALNFGDCIAYALAAEMRQPLLFKGTDFSKTDIASALG